jgi:hypothetical protein
LPICLELTTPSAIWLLRTAPTASLPVVIARLETLEVRTAPGARLAALTARLAMSLEWILPAAA